MTKYILAVCVAALVGCTTIHEINQKDQFEKTSRSYEQALRWGEWVAASNLLEAESQTMDYKAIEDLKQIKVTSYEVNEMVIAEDQLQVQQVVEIQYYHIYKMKEKTLIDRQTWKYHEKSGWRLVSGFPQF